ncbi:MAG: hypothetical protein K2V38_03485, partial [Gemmataceae bacterium]|nr:hypothetical protein [Gemmataceae bacterium]
PLTLPHSAARSLDVSLGTDVRFGPPVLGPADKLADRLAGKVVVLGFWGGEFSGVLERMDRLADELGPYGLVAVCPYAYQGEVEDIRKKAEARDARSAVVQVAGVNEPGTSGFPSPPGGHAMLFGPDGKCVHRGSAYEVEEPARAAVGRALVAAAVGRAAPPKGLKPVTDAFAAGAGPVAVYPKVAALFASPDEETKAAAKALGELILAPGRRALDDAQAKAKTDPVAAFIEAERVAARFKGTPLEKKAGALAVGLRGERAVAAELKARAAAAEVEKLAGKLRAQPGSFNPTDSRFQSKNQAALAQLKEQLQQLQKQYPTAPATAAAEKIAREFV